MDKVFIENIFKSFEKLKVLIIGDVMIDSYLWGNVERISPEAPVPIVEVNKREERLGGAANVALNIQSLGATPIITTIIGDDKKANDFIEILDENNLSAEGIIKSKKRITTTKFRVIGNNTQLLRVDEEVKTNIDTEEEELLIAKIEKIINDKNIDVIIFQDYDKGVITKNIIDITVKYANSKNIPIAVDPKKRNFLSYNNVTLFKPNLKELNEGLNIKVERNNIESIKNATKILFEKLNIKLALITLSEAGVYISNYNKEEIIPAHIRNISDVSGAGDTVISVASLCLALNLDISLIAKLSNLAGGLVCEEVGVVPINRNIFLEQAIKTV